MRDLDRSWPEQMRAMMKDGVGPFISHLDTFRSWPQLNATLDRQNFINTLAGMGESAHNRKDTGGNHS